MLTKSSKEIYIQHMMINTVSDQDKKKKSINLCILYQLNKFMALNQVIPFVFLLADCFIYLVHNRN